RRVARALDQALGRAAVEPARELSALALAGLPQPPRSLRDRGARLLAVELGSGGAAAHRVWKHVAVGERTVLDEGERSLEGGVVLAGESPHQIRTGGRV